MEGWEEDVGGFYVAVDYSKGVQVCKAFEEIVEDCSFCGWRENAALEHAAEIIRHEGKHQHEAIALLGESFGEFNDVLAFHGGQNASFSDRVMGHCHHGRCCYFQSHDLVGFWIFGLEDVGEKPIFPVVSVGVAANLSAVFW